MATKTYDPNRMLFSFAGRNISGWAKGTFIEVDFDEDAFTKQTGAGGETARAKNNNRGGTVKITLMAHVQSNDILSAIAAADQLTNSGVGSIFGKEFNGTTRFSSGNAWVKKLPKVERSEENGTVEWMFDCADLDVFVGGLI